jgi:MOSC domain-containing protein YiiM
VGSLIDIYVADAAGAPLQRVEAGELVRGKGIVGDRYFLGTGTYSPFFRKPAHEVTLIEAEEIEAFNARCGTDVRAEDLRRNFVTRGIRLNDLVGISFNVGGVVLKGIRLCEPCDYIARARPEILAGLAHRAGLYAAILVGGVVRTGDAITGPNEAAAAIQAQQFVR